VTGGVFALAVMVIRQQVGGQVSLAGLGFSAEDAENLRSIELWAGGGISLAVSCYVGFKAFSDLAPLTGGNTFYGHTPVLSWWWTFFLPILIATWVFGTLYYWGYAGMMRAA
jgi:hypothetical protein